MPFIGADLFNFFEKLKASYWFLPAIMALAAVFLSFIMPAFDKYYGAEWFKEIGWFYINRPDGARSVLSVIAGSMITVASVTFSMTITAVAFATGQIGPRLINNFMRDKTNQLTLGTFIATFLYALLVLRTIISASEAQDSQDAIEAFVPHISLMLAILLMLASVSVLIMYIHHIPESINISNIIARVGRALIHDIDQRFPDELDKKMDGRSTAIDPFVAENIHKDGIAVKAHKSGYIQVLDENNLKQIAIENDLRIRLEYRPGNFTVKGDTLLYVAPKNRVNEDLVNKILSCFAVGQERTQTQDLLFLSDELVEIIGRALSPGINDPFTAISAMDWFHNALAVLSTREIPGPYYYDDENKIRIVARTIDFEQFSNSVFSKIRPYVSSDRNAAMHCMKVLGELIFLVEDETHKDVLIRHARLLVEACKENLRLRMDCDVIEQRHQIILDCLKNSNKRTEYFNNTSWLGGTA